MRKYLRRHSLAVLIAALLAELAAASYVVDMLWSMGSMTVFAVAYPLIPVACYFLTRKMVSMHEDSEIRQFWRERYGHCKQHTSDIMKIRKPTLNPDTDPP